MEDRFGQQTAGAGQCGIYSAKSADCSSEIISELRTSPESLTSTFKLYRNLDALYDVFESVAESAGAFGSKDEFQSLENDVSAFEKERRSVAERMEALAGAKENEVTRLRAALQTAQANTPVAPPKKTVVDDTAPAKKPAPKKKAAPKPNPMQRIPLRLQVQPQLRRSKQIVHLEIPCRANLNTSDPENPKNRTFYSHS